MTGSERFSARQHQALRALLEHPTISAAAASCGLSERTIGRYLEDEDFRAEYLRLRGEILNETVGALLQGGREAVAALRRGLLSEDEGVTVRSARYLLVLMLRGVELVDLEERIRRLEEEADGQT